MDIEFSAYFILTIIFCAGLFILYLDLRALVLWIAEFRRKRRIKAPDQELSGDNIKNRKKKSDKILTAIAVIFTALGVFCFIYGFTIEPYRLSITQKAFTNPRIPKGSSLKIAHITDLHLEKHLKIHDRILVQLKDFAPDMILLTGDYVNDSDAEELFRNFSASLSAIAPTYAVDGNWDEEAMNKRVFSKAGVHYLEDRIENMEIRGTHISLIGISAFGAHIWKKIAPKVTTDTLNILLTHSPDMIPEISESGMVDFYFCGHSHGGQVRLPLYGAIVTLCYTGKRYEMGLYEENGMIAYTNRGVGMEGGAAPRVRFLAPPELALFTISGK